MGPRFDYYAGLITAADRDALGRLGSALEPERVAIADAWSVDLVEAAPEYFPGGRKEVALVRPLHERILRRLFGYLRRGEFAELFEWNYELNCKLIQRDLESRRELLISLESLYLSAAISQRRIRERIRQRLGLRRTEAAYTRFNAHGMMIIGHAYADSRERYLHDTVDRIERADAHVRELNAELQRQTRELCRSNDELERFTDTIAHELKSPLRAIDLYARGLADSCEKSSPEEVRRHASRLEETVHRLRSRIDSLHEYSRVRGSALERRPVQLDTILMKILEDLEPALRESGVKVSHGPLPDVSGDEGLIGVLLQNLIDNAIKFRSPKSPRVELYAEPHADGWLLSVRDNGIGIEPEDAERAFALFGRLNPCDRYPGSGLGLALCKAIVERHDGRIWHSANPDSGSTFWFTLPARRGRRERDRL